MFYPTRKSHQKNSIQNKPPVSVSGIFQRYNYAIFLLSVLAVTIFLYLAIYTSSQVITRSIEDSNNLIRARISATFDQMTSIAQHLSNSDILQKYLTCKDEYELIGQWQQLQSMTEPFLRANSDLYSIIIYRSNHRIPFFSNYPFPDNAPFYSMASFYEKEDSPSNLFSVISSRYSNLPSYAVYSHPVICTLNNEHFREFLGNIVLVINPDFIDKNISLISPKGIISSISITDENGVSIASTQISKEVRPNSFMSLSTAKTSPIEGTNWYVTCYSNGQWIARQYISIFLAFSLFIFLTLFILLRSRRHLLKYFSHPILSLRSEIRTLDFLKNEQLSSYNTLEINEIAETINHLLLKYYQESEKKRQLELAHYESQISKKVSDLQFLVSQISPHFLLNTLSCIGGIATLYQADEILDIISELSEMLRYSLCRSDMVTLRDEHENIQKYFNIIRIRFQNTYHLETSIPDNLLGCPMPKMILQPLVENSLYHGLEQKNSGHILISAQAKESILYITISDNGIGMSPEQTVSMQNLLNNSSKLEYSTLLEKKIGNVNICRRIKLTYGEEYGMKIDSTPDVGTTVTVYFPVIVP